MPWASDPLPDADSVRAELAAAIAADAWPAPAKPAAVRSPVAGTALQTRPLAAAADRRAQDAADGGGMPGTAASRALIVVRGVGFLALALPLRTAARSGAWWPVPTVRMTAFVDRRCVRS